MSRFGNLYESFNKCGGPESLGALFLSYAFTKYAFSIQVCKGPSMVPTMRPEGELILVDIRSYRRNRLYDIGDIVVSKHKRDQNTWDTVLYVDYNSGKLKSNVIDYGQVWLTGDNPLQSNDSRVYGQVPLGLLIGTVKCKFWYRPLHFRWADELDPELASREVSPATYYAKSYNVSRGSSRHTDQDWRFLYSLLKDDERSSNLIPAEREMLLRLAESKIRKPTKLLEQSPDIPAVQPAESIAERAKGLAMDPQIASKQGSGFQNEHSETAKVDESSKR